jgi:hypothetical protein
MAFMRIEANETEPVRPEHILVDRELGFTGLWGAFGNPETETSAVWLVHFAQSRGSWEPFPRNELAEYYGGFKQDGFTFNNLIATGYIVHEESSKLFYFTHEFIAKCYLVSPISKARDRKEVKAEWRTEIIKRIELLLQSLLSDEDRRMNPTMYFLQNGSWMYMAQGDPLSPWQAQKLSKGYILIDTSLPVADQVPEDDFWTYPPEDSGDTAA